MNAVSTRGRSIVLTGASSGIGHATALELARRGERIVLASRNRATLEPVARECESLGAAGVLVVPTDVTDPAQVEALASAAISAFGHIDVWINNVGVGVVGLYDKTPLALHRRVVESNLFGHMYGAHAALRHFRKRGRGTIINMISMGGWVAAPYAAAYTASKFALRGLTESIRAEVSSLPDVHVCAVYPTFVDTPGVEQHGANQIGKTLRTPPGAVDPQDVADAIANLVDAPRDTTAIGLGATPARIAHALAPGLTGRIGAHVMESAFDKADEAPLSTGNLFFPSVGTTMHGPRTVARQREGQISPLVGLAALGAGWLLLKALSRR